MFRRVKKARLVAQKTLGIVGINADDIRLIQFGTNITFCALRGTDKYAIRISSFDTKKTKKIESEIEVIRYLEQDEEINSCKLIQLDYQQDYMLIEDEESNYLVLLFEWIEHPFLNKRVNVNDAYYAGRVLAQFHECMLRKKWKSQLIEWNPEYLFSSKGIYNIDEVLLKISDDFRDIILRGLNLVLIEFKDMCMDSTNYGIVHGDFYFRNLYSMGDRVGIIDFETIGYGYYLMDLYNFEDVGCFDENQFLDGYRSIRVIPDGYQAYKRIFNVFYCIRYLALIVLKSSLNDIERNEGFKSLICELKEVLE